MATCAVPSCERPSAIRGWCKTHYMRWYQTGDVREDVPLRPIFYDPLEGFWARVNKSDDCWAWTGTTMGMGHGRYRWQGEERLAHVVSWIIEHGVDPRPLCVLHHCDNPPCVRPSHLFLGTRADNTADMMSKGRDYWSQRTHCKNGHEFTVHGTLRTRKNGHTYRLCRVCKADEQRRRRSRSHS